VAKQCSEIMRLLSAITWRYAGYVRLRWNARLCQENSTTSLCWATIRNWFEITKLPPDHR
jgi:hypothetical protein